jgi:general stress protein CsbA
VERQSQDKKKHIITKDVVGLLIGEIVSTKKNHIVTKDVVGLLLGVLVSIKKTHRCKGCGWLASRRGSKYKKKTHRRKGCGWLFSRR